MLHHVVYGFDSTEKKPTLVFLNGMTQTTAHWKSHGRYFSKNFRVVTYDAQGQGDSPVEDDPLTLDVHADNLKGLLDHLDVASATFVGFSHGARVALNFAVRHENYCDGLILCSATAKPTAIAKTIIRSWNEVLKRGGLEAMSWAALPMILGPAYLEENERMISGIIRASVERNDERGVAALLAEMSDQPELADLADRADVDALVIFGTHDPLVKKKGAQDLAARLDGKCVEIDAGHTIPIERPDLFREQIEDFVD